MALLILAVAQWFAHSTGVRKVMGLVACVVSSDSERRARESEITHTRKELRELSLVRVFYLARVLFATQAMGLVGSIATRARCNRPRGFP